MMTERTVGRKGHDALMWLAHAKGSAYLAWHLRGQARFAFQPPEAIADAQARRVRRMVAYAYATVPYYREAMDGLGVRPDDVRSAADLTCLPIVERELLQRDPDRLRSSAAPRDRCLALRTSGSAGAPRDVHHSAVSILQNAAHGERDRAVVTRLIGRRTGYREMILASPTGSASKVRRFVHDHILSPSRLRIERQVLSPFDPPEEIARRIEAFRPDVLHGFGSALELLFARYQAGDAPRHKPKVITFSSDALSAAARRTIEDGYGIPVFGTYQAIEALKIGFECERRDGYHLNADLYPVRIVDDIGRDVELGETGEVVVSNLVNRGTVLLNYRLGDLATLARDPCPCGRSLPLLASLDGRRDDVIVLPSGRVVHPQALRTVFNAEPGVWQYQVVHEAPTRFAVAVVAAEGTDRGSLGERVASALAARIGDSVTIDVAFVEAVARTPGGKVRPIVSRWGGGNGRAGDG